MSGTHDPVAPVVGTIDVDGRRYAVSVELAFDGSEHAGHLWFVEEDWDEDAGIRDQVGIAGPSPNAIVESARSLSSDELARRYRRAAAMTRRFHGLRKATEDILAHIRHLNKVATSMRAGLLDIDDAAREIDATEQRLVELVRQLRTYAGVEGAP
ncbi:MAG: hypothetical protein ACT4R6_07795, partial [Gemmatimonadaceae bacterium]